MIAAAGSKTATGARAANRMELTEKERQEMEAARERRLAEQIMRNDDLLGLEPFRKFLTELAVKGEYFTQHTSQDAWYDGFQAALVGIVNDVVLRSTKGPAFLAEMARAYSAALKKQI